MITIRDQAINAIQDGLRSVTFDPHAKTMTFVYEAGSPIMVNECIAWSQEVDEVVIYDGERMAHRYKQIAPEIWDDELTRSERVCSLAPHDA
jgi:hypothetical protein